MEAWTERIATLTLPTVVLLLAGLTFLRLILRALRTGFSVFLSELIEAATLAIALVFLLLRPFVVQSYLIPSASMHPTLVEGDRLLVNKLLYRFRAPQRGEIVVFRAPREADPAQKEFIKRLIGLPGDTIEIRPGYVKVGRDTYFHTNIRDVLGVPQSISDREEQRGDAPPLRLTSDAIWLGNQRLTGPEFAARAGQAGANTEIHPGIVLRNGAGLLEQLSEDPEYSESRLTVPPGNYYVLGDNRNQSNDSHRWGCVPADRVIGRADALFWPPARLRRLP